MWFLVANNVDKGRTLTSLAYRAIIEERAYRAMFDSSSLIKIWLCYKKEVRG